MTQSRIQGDMQMQRVAQLGDAFLIVEAEQAKISDKIHEHQQAIAGLEKRWDQLQRVREACKDARIWISDKAGA